MTFYITYFYNIRFLSSNMIPVSTAMYDPAWFHNNLGSKHVFLDSRGVYNGVRYPDFSPGKLTVQDCNKNCDQNPPNCTSLKAYRDYIYSLDFKKAYKYFTDLAAVLKKTRKLRYEPEIVLLVHEKPDNPCSERSVLMDWFHDNGVDLIEFEVKNG